MGAYESENDRSTRHRAADAGDDSKLVWRPGRRLLAGAALLGAVLGSYFDVHDQSGPGNHRHSFSAPVFAREVAAEEGDDSGLGFGSGPSRLFEGKRGT